MKENSSENKDQKAASSLLNKINNYFTAIEKCFSEDDISNLANELLTNRYSGSLVEVSAEIKAMELEENKQSLRHLLNEKKKNKVIRGETDVAMVFVAPKIPDGPYKEYIQQGRDNADYKEKQDKIRNDLIQEQQIIDNLKYSLIEYSISGGKKALTTKFLEMAMALEEEQCKSIDVFKEKNNMYGDYSLFSLLADECKNDVNTKTFNLIKPSLSMFSSTLPKEYYSWFESYKCSDELFQMIKQYAAPIEAEKIISTLKKNNKRVEIFREKNIESESGNILLGMINEQAQVIKLNNSIDSSRIDSILEEAINLASK